jgi:EpsI family protein
VKINPLRVLLIISLLLATALLARGLTPHELMARSTASIDLEKAIPVKFGAWTARPNTGLVTPTDDTEYVEADDKETRVYSKELGRGYTDDHGHLIMLLIAYGPVQNHRLKAHRPEFCYAAAGFQIKDKTDTTLMLAGRQIRMTRLVTERESRFEPVTYWLRTGEDVAAGIVDQQLIRLKYALRGVIPDGALVRVSTVGIPAEQSYEIQDKFLQDLLSSLNLDAKRFLLGHA